jgi:hypothetical protein
MRRGADNSTGAGYASNLGRKAVADAAEMSNTGCNTAKMSAANTKSTAQMSATEAANGATGHMSAAESAAHVAAATSAATRHGGAAGTERCRGDDGNYDLTHLYSLHCH